MSGTSRTMQRGRTPSTDPPTPESRGRSGIGEPHGDGRRESGVGAGSGAVVLYATRNVDAGRLARCLSAYEVLSVRSWEDLMEAAPASECSVVTAPRLRRTQRRLRQFRLQLPLLPLVLVTRPHPRNARLLGKIDVDEVLWLDDAPRTLPRAIERARNRSALTRVAEALAEAERLPRRLRTALSTCCTVHPPVTRVDEIGRLADRSRSSLWRDWKTALEDRTDPDLKSFLAWILLLRAAGAKSPDRTVRDVCEELRIHPQTLYRLSRRLTGESFGDLAADAEGLLELFVRDVLRPIVGDAARNVLV